jgi:hypothetical protein
MNSNRTKFNTSGDGQAGDSQNESDNGQPTASTVPPNMETNRVSLTDEDTQAALDLIAALIEGNDCDTLFGEQAIEALVRISITDEATAIRLRDQIDRLPGMRGRKKHFAKLFTLRLREVQAQRASVHVTEVAINDYRQTCQVATDFEGHKSRIPIADISAFVIERVQYVGTEAPKPRLTLEVCKYDYDLQEPVFRTISLTTDEFNAMRWHIDYLPTGWGIRPGYQEAMKYAIWALSEKVTVHRTVYQHLGWIKLDLANQAHTSNNGDGGTNLQWIYLHAGGAIGTSGTIPGIGVDLGESSLTNYKLPDPPTGEALIAAVRAVLEFQRLKSDKHPNSAGLAAVCLSLPWRAAYDYCDFSVLLVGQSGTHKTTVAQLMVNPFSTAYTYRSHPAAPMYWVSSEAALRMTLSMGWHIFILIYDDNKNRDETIEKRMHMVLQAQGNGGGRQTMSQITHGIAPSYVPRGGLVSTHEDNITNYSSLGRTLILRVSKATPTINMEVVEGLQQHARAGTFTAAMAGYLQWMAPRRDVLLANHFQRFQAAYADFIQHTQGAHERTPEILAELLVGADYFLEFAIDVGAITPDEQSAQRQSIRDGLLSLVADQIEEQHNADDATRFLQILHGLLATGEVYLENGKGYDLQLTQDALPDKGKNLIIVALRNLVANQSATVNDVFHFRIFDTVGEKVVDTNEKTLPHQTLQIKNLKEQLEKLWPPRELTRSEKDQAITAVTTIVGHAQSQAPAGRERACGWHQERFLSKEPEWQHNYNATRIGMILDDMVYIYAEPVAAIIHSYAKRQGQELRPTNSIFAALLERGIIVGKQEKRDKQPRPVIRRKINGTVLTGLLQFPITKFFDETNPVSLTSADGGEQ